MAGRVVMVAGEGGSVANGESWIRPGQPRREPREETRRWQAHNSPTNHCPGCGELGAKVQRTSGRVQYRKCDCGANFKTIIPPPDLPPELQPEPPEAPELPPILEG